MRLSWGSWTILVLCWLSLRTVSTTCGAHPLLDCLLHPPLPALAVGVPRSHFCGTAELGGAALGRTLYVLEPEKARAVASETLAVWCSLAARLGMWAIKAELEDLCFALLKPYTFWELKTSLEAAWLGVKARRAVKRKSRAAKRSLAEVKCTPAAGC